MIPFFLLPDSLHQRRRDERLANVARRLQLCEDWDPKMPWKKEMNLRANSYQVRNLFPEVIPRGLPPNPNLVETGFYAESPSGEWRYTVNILPKGGMLNTWCGSKIGTVLFDGAVHLPAIYRREMWRKEEKVYGQNPWMSLTPAEVMSMRSGLRYAKGHTIVAGLGLGHFLVDVTKKKSVEKVTLVEISQDIVDWLYPRIEPLLGMKVEVIVGDAKAVIPGLEADVALIDIDSGYGNNVFHAPTRHIQKVWVWGSSKHNGENNDW